MTMALINCPECGKEISDSVKKCPHCGKKIKDNRFKEFIFKHKIIFGLFIIICVFIISIGIYIGTHEFLSYEENAVLTAIDHVKNSSAYKESVHIKNVSVAYCAPEKIKMVDGGSRESYAKTLEGMEDKMDYDAYSQNIINILVEYKTLSQSDQMIEAEMICSLDTKCNVLFSASSLEEDVDYYSSYMKIAEGQSDVDEFRLLKKDTLKKISKIDRRKKIVVTDEFPQFSSEDLDGTLMKYIDYQLEYELDDTYYQDTSFSDLEEGDTTYVPYAIIKVTDCFKNFNDKKKTKEVAKKVNAFLIESAKEKNKEAVENAKDNYYTQAISFLEDEEQILENILDEDKSSADEVKSLKEKCTSLKQDYQKKLDEQQLESAYNNAIYNLEEGYYDKALSFFEENKDYKESEKYFNAIKDTEKWMGTWKAEIPYLEGSKVDTEITINRVYHENEIYLAVYFDADGDSPSSYSGGSAGGFSWKPSGGASGSGHGSFQGGAAGLTLQSYTKTTPVKFQKMASYFIYNKGYYYKIASEDKIEPAYPVTTYSGYDYMDDDDKVLIKDLVVPIQLNKDGTITILNEYNWMLTKE